ncbi:tripartite tricarboxylate transporter permease [Actinoplanes sp. NPDC051411]|uniref:tripartite tricarboxylate transporter permease n=1 Tax=Actinoplanes sp. NPDC051411 TaxID=3155522 RepID=UPI003424BF89
MTFFLHSLAQGTAYLTDPIFLLIIVAGTLWGVIGGVHPGGSATLSVGVALPFTFVMNGPQAVAFLLSVLVGINFANSLPSVLIGVPGTPSAVLTAQDGFQLHQRGETGTALGIVYLASIFGQFVSIIFFVAFVVPLSNLAYLFLSPELFAMALLGMTAVVGLAGRSIVKAVISAAVGLAVALVGLDPLENVPRFTLGLTDLQDGVNPIAVVIGLLAVSEVIRQCRQVYPWSVGKIRLRSIKFPNRAVLRRILRPALLGTTLGVIIGIAPGASAEAASYMAYQQAKAMSKTPEEFGKGSIEGIAANESAQQASQAGDLIPTLAVGIPGGSTMVLILAALTLHGLVPGPLLIKQSPELLFGAVGGLLGAAVFLALIGWMMAKVAARLAGVDRSVILVLALALTLIGVYSVDQSMFDVGVCLVFGFVGYFMLRYGYAVAAAALGVILGDDIESTLRQGILIADGSFLTFVSRPVTAVVLALAALLLAYGIRSEWRSRRRPPASPDEGLLDVEAETAEPQSH